MSNFDRLHDREVREHQKAMFYVFGLAALSVFVVIAVLLALR